MAETRAWYAFYECESGTDRYAWIDALASAGLLVYPLDPDHATGVGLVFFVEPSPGLCEFIRTASRAGVERVVAVGPSRGVLSNGDAWRLLQYGAADVVAWGNGAAAVASDIGARVARWERIDEIVRSPLVRDSLVGTSTVWTAVMRQAVEAALFTDAPVLITGDTGTGKELVARLIHTLDPRPRKGQLVLLDCATVIPELSGSEFFGHERGAFTGAVSARDGVFALSDGGTLFLDEVAELTPVLQAELLRVVQEGTYKRVGGNQWRSTRFRLLCATNHDLAPNVREHSFREDFFYRIATVQLRLPPLRERTEDILPLARHFLEQLRPTEEPPELDEAVRELLLVRDYPGNVRDLRQLVTRMAYRHTGRGPITPGHVPEGDRPVATPGGEWRDAAFEDAIRRAVALGAGLREIAQAATEIAIRLALTQEGTLQRAARRLGVTDRALQMRRKKKRQGGARRSDSSAALAPEPPIIADR